MSSEAKAPKHYKYYDLVMATFVTGLLCANVIGAGKVTTFYGFSFGAGVLFFPISYLFGDILTEVYSYARARRVVWTGFAALCFASFMAWAVVQLPPAPGWKNQAAYQIAFGSTWRIALASLIAFFWGELANSYVLAKMKLLTKGKYLWTRTIGSTLVGEAVDTLIFYPIAFMGTWSTSLLIKVMIANYIIKVVWEIIATPFTYKIVNTLKEREHEDFFDTDTNFTPFSVKVD